MTDVNTKSSVYVRNVVENSPLSVTPLLYLSNGVKLSLPVVVLQPAGTAVIDINDALANQGLAPYAALSGYIELQYQWAWDALCATVSSVDAAHSTIFTYGLRPVGASSGAAAGPQNGPATAGPQTIEGAWWKQEAGVTGFVALSNTTEQPLPATLQVTDANAGPLGSYQVTVSPHGTKRVELQELTFPANSLGGLHVTFNGLPDALSVNGSLADPSKGYSATIPFGPPPGASAKSIAVSYAEIGLMTGQADPMMHFPTGTAFTPYSVLRNLNSQPASITPALWWMTGGAAASASLPPFTLAPLQTKLLDMPALLTAAGLKNFNGAVNLVLQFQGVPGSVIAASGSADQSENYVFEVVPRGVGEGASKSLSYWSTANGDDTMVTLWNPADEAQDFVFTVFFSGGHYLYPIHLGPRATSMFNMSELIENQLPDSEGNVIPLFVREGSGKLSGSVAENQHILVAMDAGTYNVHKATCVYRCISCNGAVSFTVAPNPFAVSVSGTSQMSMKDRWNTGSTYDVTSSSSWSSSDTSVATVDQTALAHGISAGSATLSAFDDGETIGGQDCNYYPSCANDMPVGGGGSGPGNVITISQSPTILNMSSGDTGKGISVTVSPASVASSVVIAQGGITNPNSSSPASFTYNKPTNFTGNDLWTVSIGGNPSGFPSGIQNSQACSYGVCSSQLSNLAVPPQILIQMIQAEAGGTNVTTMTAVGEVARNRFSSSIFNPPYSTYQNGIPGQFATTSTPNGIEPELDIAASVFTGSSAGTFCGSLSFWTPTSSQWNIVQNALSSGTTTFPGGTGAPTYDPSKWPTSGQQILFVPAVGTNSSGVPYFLFLAQRSSSQAAAVNASCN